MRSRDTSREADARQVRILRSMSSERRLLLALDMSLFARELAKSRIRQEHPEWSEKQVRLEIFRRAFLPHPLPAWVR
jgi:Rv0078B-related antitoxin